MKVIVDNPYRIAGLLAGATAKEQDRQIKRLKQYIDADQQPPQDDFSFPIFGKLNRTLEMVEYVASRLHLDSDKLNAALFWFYSGNPITDEPALEALKDFDAPTAINIWSKMTASGKVTQKNCSAFQNLSTFLLWQGISTGIKMLTVTQFKSRIGTSKLYLRVNPNDNKGFVIDDSGNVVAALSEKIRKEEDIVKPVLVYNEVAKMWMLVNWYNRNSFVDLFETVLEQGIRMKLQFLDSDSVHELQSKVTDETYKTTKQAIQLTFLNILHKEVEQIGEITPLQWIEMLSKYDFSAKEEYLSSFVQKPIEQIEKEIEATGTKRKSNQTDAANIGSELYYALETGLKQLQSTGINYIKYSSIVDKVSEEVLQCGIDYFLCYRDTDTDPSSLTMDLYRKANGLAIGSVTKQKCQENIDNLQEWITNKPARDRKRKGGSELQFIVDKIKSFQSLPETVPNAKDLIDNCNPKLSILKSRLGATDPIYLEISSAVVSNAQSMLVAGVNKAQSEFGAKAISLPELSALVDSAYEVAMSIVSMDMTDDLKQQFQKNRETLEGIRNQISSATTPEAGPSPKESKTPKNTISRGCYIATAVYGDYDHPQVLILRRFRDETLDKSAFGRGFIQTYYRYSPKLAEHLEGKTITNRIIRGMLNSMIKMIK